MHFHKEKFLERLTNDEAFFEKVKREPKEALSEFGLTVTDKDAALINRQFETLLHLPTSRTRTSEERGKPKLQLIFSGK